MLTAWSLQSYRAYLLNAEILNPFYQLQDAKTIIAIDNAYTGSFANAESHIHLSDQPFLSGLKASQQGHLNAQFRFDSSDPYSNTELLEKTLVLLRNSHMQAGYQFNSWRCPSSPSPDLFSITNPIANATVDERYSYFICHGITR